MSLLPPNLKAFVSVARLGTVHGAAEDLHLTQTGVTQRIRSLERELSVTLFLRSRRGMELTHEGKILSRYCTNVIDLESQTLSGIAGAGQEAPVYVTVVGPTSVMAARVIESCKALYDRWPKLQLSFVFDDTSGRIDRIRSGSAALAIVPPERVPQEMDSKLLKPDRYVLVASPKWQGRKLKQILQTERIIDFAEDDPTTLHYLKKFGLEANVGQPRLYINNNEAIIKLFKAGVGFGTLTQEIASPHLADRGLIALNNGAATEDKLALAWYPRPEMPKYFKAIVDAIK
ncbi:MAG: LysR family transcriptional regulator [Oligoflexales bacterium]